MRDRFSYVFATAEFKNQGLNFFYGTVFEILYFFSFYDHFLLDKSYLEPDLIVFGTQFKVLR